MKRKIENIETDTGRKPIVDKRLTIVNAEKIAKNKNCSWTLLDSPEENMVFYKWGNTDAWCIWNFYPKTHVPKMCNKMKLEIFLMAKHMQFMPNSIEYKMAKLNFENKTMLWKH